MRLRHWNTRMHACMRACVRACVREDTKSASEATFDGANLLSRLRTWGVHERERDRLHEEKVCWMVADRFLAFLREDGVYTTGCIGE
jgi:hypothetical protein